MNPVRTLGSAIAANNYKAIWVYLLAPILGALGGAGTYTAVKLPEEDDNAKTNASSNHPSFRRWSISSVPMLINHRKMTLKDDYVLIHIYV